MTPKMKLLLQHTGDAKINRKLLKPQVERHRRERMNRSLETLRHLLLKGAPQEGGAQRRIEKAEILERTVHFLHTVAAEGATEKPAAAAAGCRDGGDAFGDGFSACMQRAARYLGPQGTALRPAEATLDAALLAARFASPLSPTTQHQHHHHHRSPSVRRRIQVQVQHQTGDVAISRGAPVQRASLGAAQRPLRANQAETLSQSLSRSGPSLWRPWP